MDETKIAIEIASQLGHAFPYIIGAIVGMIVYAIRIEGKMLSNKQIADLSHKNVNQRIDMVEVNLKELEKKHDLLQDKIVDKLGVIEKHLAKIEGRLSISDDAK